MIYDVFIQKLATLDPSIGRFVGTIPGDVDVALMLRQPLSGTPVDPSIPGRYKGGLQVVTRHRSPPQGRQLASAIQGLITVQSREWFEAGDGHGPGHLDLAFPRTLPVEYPRLDSNLWEWSQVFDVVWAIHGPA